MIIRGVVVEGNKRGKRLGFPTLNVPLPAARLPDGQGRQALEVSLPEGIYISRVKIEGKMYNSLTFIGPAKTYDETTYQSETYVFNFDKDIYGQTVKVMLLQKIRDNEKFVSEEKLIEQMENDKAVALEYFDKRRG